MGDFLFDKNNPYFFAHTNDYHYDLPSYETIDDVVIKT
jgi:hypothetical protein